MQKKPLFSSQKGYRKYFGTWLILFLFAPFFVAAANELSPTVLNDLRDAISTGQYAVQLLKRKSVKGVQKLVLVGENHFKDQPADWIGRKIASNFKLIAVEGDISRVRLVNEYLQNYEICKARTHGLKGKLYHPHFETFPQAYHKYLLTRDPLEKKLIDLLHHNLTLCEIDRQRFISNFEPFQIKDLINLNLKNFLISLGFAEDTQFTSKKAIKLMSTLKKSLFEKHLEVIQLENFDHLPIEILELESKIRSAEKLIRLSFSCCSFAGLTFFAQHFFPDMIPAVAAYPVYFASTLSVMHTLKQASKINISSILPARSKVLAKRITGAMDFRTYADVMLVIVSRSNFKEVFRLLKSQYDWTDDTSWYHPSQ